MSVFVDIFLIHRALFGSSRRPRPGEWRDAGVGALILLLLIGGYYATNLRVVVTPSVPIGVYYTKALTRPVRVARGSYVSFDATDADAPEVLRQGIADGWLPSRWKSTPLMKQVVAVAGDVITYEALPTPHLAVNGVALPHSAHRGTDSQGRPLPMPSYPIRLGPGEVWLGSEHDMGFDSRYFGPAKANVLGRKGTRIWTW